MPTGPDPARLAAAAARLDALREAAREGGDDVLSALVISGDRDLQRSIDDWLDQGADTLRAVAEECDDLLSILNAVTPRLAPSPSSEHTYTGPGGRP